MARCSSIVPPGSPLTDGVIVVRPRRESDLEAIAEASHDPETLRWLDDPPMDAEARRTAMRRTDEAWRSGRAAPLTIADASTDDPVGTINLQFRAEKPVSLAYNVFACRRGQGIAPRAVRLVAEWALHDLGVEQLVLEADEANTASIRVAEKCGFQPAGTTSTTGPDGSVHTRRVFSRSPGQPGPTCG